jgi:dolichol-phosphate mannosyltransferase
MKIKKKLISIVMPTYNEVENIKIIVERVTNTCSLYENYEFEYIFIDNASTDGTIELLRDLANLNKKIKVILNNKNFGHIKSPYWGILQAFGDAVIYLASDLQDPPELIHEFIKEWESGFEIVMGVKTETEEAFHIQFIKKIYYRLIKKFSNINLVNDSTGFGLYSKKVIDLVRSINDPNPYFRGLVCEFGYETKQVRFRQENRKKGKSKNNIYTLVDYGLLGLINQSNFPVRLVWLMGIFVGFISILISMVFITIKLIYWDSIPIGIAPIVIGIFFMFGIQFIFFGILGEYIISIQNYLKNRPIVVEKERINFE